MRFAFSAPHARSPCANICLPVASWPNPNESHTIGDNWHDLIRSTLKKTITSVSSTSIATALSSTLRRQDSKRRVTTMAFCELRGLGAARREAKAQSRTFGGA